MERYKITDFIDFKERFNKNFFSFKYDLNSFLDDSIVDLFNKDLFNYASKIKTKKDADLLQTEIKNLIFIIENYKLTLKNNSYSEKKISIYKEMQNG